MKQRYKAALVAAILGQAATSANAALLAGWDFQTTSNGGTALQVAPNTPTSIVANFGTGTLSLDGSNGSSAFTTTTSGNELTSFAGTTNNAGTGFSTTTTGAAALGLVNSTSNGKALTLKLSTTGFQDLVLTYSSQRTGTGFTGNQWSYSLDGSSFTNFGNGIVPAASFATVTVDFTSISALNNASTVYLKYTLAGASSASGNNRLDNIQLNATASGSTTLEYFDNVAGAGTGGNGPWNSSATNWNAQSDGTGTPGIFDPSRKAIFAGTPGTATVDSNGITENGGVQFDGDGFTVDGGTLTVGTSNVVIVSNAGDSATISANLAGSTGLSKNGPGKLALSGSASSFTGSLLISNGTVNISGDGALGNTANDIQLNAGALEVGSTVVLNASRDLSGAGIVNLNSNALTLNGTVSVGSLSLAGAGVATFAGASNTVSTLTFSGANTLNVTGGTLTTNSITANQSSGTATLAANVDLGGSTRDITVSNAGAGLVISGNISNTSAFAAMQKLGPGALTLTGDNSLLQGNIRFGIAGTSPAVGGTLRINNNKALGSNTLQFNSGTLEVMSPLTGANAVANSLSIGAGQTGSGAVFTGSDLELAGTVVLFKATGSTYQHRIGVYNSTTFNNSFAAASGTGTSTGLTIDGTGTLTLANATNGVDVPITVDNTAKLYINGALSSSAATVRVNSGATLGGAATIAGAVTAAGTLSPGNGVGQMNVSALTLGDSTSGGGHLVEEIASVTGTGLQTSGADKILDSGALTINSTSSSPFTVHLAGTVSGFVNSETYQWILVDGTTDPTPAFDASAFVVDAASFKATNGISGFFSVDFDTAGKDLVLNYVVPEPSSVALAFIGAAGLLSRRTRRRRA